MHDEIVLPRSQPNWLVRDWNELVANCVTSRVDSRRKRVWFSTAWFFIGAVSCYDAWLVEAYKVCIVQVEINPICWYIMKQSGKDLTAFICAKALGTAVVLYILSTLHARAPRLAYPVINSVATFQMGLLLFLLFC